MRYMCYNSNMKKLCLLLGSTVICALLFACAPNGGNGTDNSVSGIEIVFDAGSGILEASGVKTAKMLTDKNGKVPTSNRNMNARLDGYAFCGWYDGDTAFDENTRYSSPRTFTAKYVSGGDALVYDALFDEDATVSVNINMSSAEWKKLDADYTRFAAQGGKSPIYRMAASVTVDIDSENGDYYCYYEEVGVRMKGNTSRHNFYGDNGIYNAIHMKLSFKQTFDDVDDGYTADELKDWKGDTAARDFRKGRTLGGMEKIDLKYNSTLDETYIRELYAMKFFRKNGIYAPNITLCKLTAPNKGASNLGVYRIHEPIDEQFVSRRQIDGDKVGDLWKCTWGKSSSGADMTTDNMDANIGVEDELKNEFFAYDKKTNKKKDKNTGKRDFSSMKNFLTAINESDPDFERYLDTNYFAKFEAVNYILGNPDCIRNHANNYYVYFRKSDGKAIIIPYDYDRCLGSKQWDCFNGMSGSEITPFTRRTTLEGGLKNPLYLRLIVKGAPTNEGSVLMRYRSALISLAESDLLKTEKFNALKDSYKARYADAVNNAVNGYAGNALRFDNASGANNLPFDAYISAKLSVLRDNINNYNA